MEQIIAILKAIGIEIPQDQQSTLFAEMKKVFATSNELEQKKKKIGDLEQEKKDLLEQASKTQKELEDLQGVDVKEWEKKVKELNDTLESERNDRKLKEEKETLGNMVSEFFANKHFVNDMTADYIKVKLLDELQKDTSKGKSVSELFDSIVKDEKGEIKPNILIDEQQLEAEKRRSGIIGRSIQPDINANYTAAQLMKLKNDNPGLDITPYLKKIKERK